MRGMFAALGGYAAVQTARNLAGFFADVNNEVEQGVTGIQSLYMAIDGLDAVTARSRAGSLFEGLRRDAAISLGTLSDFREFATVAFAPMRQAGATDEQLRRVTRLGVTSGFALQGPQGARLMGLDIQQALTRGIGDVVTKNLNIALRAGGVDLDTFNEQSTAQRLVLIESALERFSASADVFGQTFEAVAATAQDNLRELGRDASGRAFQAVKLTIAETNAAYERNRDALDPATEAVDRIATAAVNAAANISGLGGAALLGLAAEERSTGAMGRLADRMDYIVGLIPFGASSAYAAGRLVPGTMGLAMGLMGAAPDLAIGSTIGVRGGAGLLGRLLGVESDLLIESVRELRAELDLAGYQAGFVPSVPESLARRGLRERTIGPAVDFGVVGLPDYAIIDPLQKLVDNTDPDKVGDGRQARRDFQIRVEWENTRQLAQGVTEIVQTLLEDEARFPRAARSRIPRPG